LITTHSLVTKQDPNTIAAVVAPHSHSVSLTIRLSVARFWDSVREDLDVAIVLAYIEDPAFRVESIAELDVLLEVLSGASCHKNILNLGRLHISSIVQVITHVLEKNSNPPPMLSW
jgi:hypothetical protein